MKTTLFFPAIRISGIQAMILGLTLILTGIACDKPEPPEVFGSIDEVIPNTPAQEFIGSYTLIQSTCKTFQFELEITDRDPVQMIDPALLNEGKMVFLRNFMNSSTPLTAVWDGGAFVATKAPLKSEGRTYLVNARVYEYLGNVTIDYQLFDQFTQRCSATFGKI